MSYLAFLTQGLVKRFGNVEALSGVDLEIPAGTIFGLRPVVQALIWCAALVAIFAPIAVRLYRRAL